MNSSKPKHNNNKPNNKKPNNNKPNNNKPNNKKPIVYKNYAAANLAVRRGKHRNHKNVKYMRNGQEVTGILEEKVEKMMINHSDGSMSYKYPIIQRIVDEKGYIYSNLKTAENSLKNGRHRYINTIRYKGENGKVVERRLKTITTQENVFTGEMGGYQKRPVRRRIMVNNNK
jgi:hypothetical protein